MKNKEQIVKVMDKIVQMEQDLKDLYHSLETVLITNGYKYQPSLDTYDTNDNADDMVKKLLDIV